MAQEQQTYINGASSLLRFSRLFAGLFFLAIIVLSLPSVTAYSGCHYAGSPNGCYGGGCPGYYGYGAHYNYYARPYHVSSGWTPVRLKYHYPYSGVHPVYY